MNYLNQVPAALGRARAPAPPGRTAPALGAASAHTPGKLGPPPLLALGSCAPASALVPLGHVPMAGYLLPLYQREGRPVPHLSPTAPPPSSPCPSQPYLLKPDPSCRMCTRHHRPSWLYSKLNPCRQNQVPAPSRTAPPLCPSHDISPPLPPCCPPAPLPVLGQDPGPEPATPGLPCSLQPSSCSVQLKVSRLWSRKKLPSAP